METLKVHAAENQPLNIYLPYHTYRHFKVINIQIKWINPIKIVYEKNLCFLNASGILYMAGGGGPPVRVLGIYWIP